MLHPAARLAFFETPDWDAAVAVRARHLLADLVKKYSADGSTATTMATASVTSKPAKGIFAMAMQGHAESKKSTSFAGKDEVEMYFGGISPVEDSFDDPLGWWKVCPSPPAY